MQIMDTLKASFEEIDDSFIELSRIWLGDADFRTLIMAQPVTREEQNNWYLSLNLRSDYKVWGVKVFGDWVGAVGIKGIDQLNRTSEYWGYIYPNEFRNKGLGKQMLEFCLEKAKDMGLDSVWLRVSLENKPARLAYKQWGFHEIPSHLEGQVWMKLCC